MPESTPAGTSARMHVRSARRLRPHPRLPGKRRVPRPLVLAASVVLSGCATLGQITALRHVDFTLESVSDVRLAGVDLASVRSFSDLSLTDGARLASAVANRQLPLSLDVNVVGTNPADNFADARMIRMDWTLLLEDRETVSGRLVEELYLPRGEPTVFPVRVELNLVEFFEGSARDLFELALSLSGQGGAPKNVALTALPTVDTALGPITYERPIRIVSTTVGR